MMTLFYIFSVCVVLQSLFAVWMLWAGGSARYAATISDSHLGQPLSIIVCAHNEAANLAQHLPGILQQSLPHYEVIVVNDASDDDSDNILQALGAQYSHLRVVNIDKEEERLLPGKKFALSRALSAAQYEHLLLCDADCSPASQDWARLMSRALQGTTDIVAGYGAYKPRPGWLNVFIRWETMHTFLQYSSYAKRGLPYMAVGRNLACKKSVLLQAQADPLWAMMPSGDDDLLIRLMGNKNNVAIVADPSAFTISEAKTSFGAWVLQKQRHVSTGKIYKKHIQFLLATYAAAHGLMWLLWLVLWAAGFGYLVSSLMMLRCLLVWSLWAIQSESLKEQRLMIYLPLCDIGWAIYHLILSPYIFFKTKKQWK